MFILCFCVEVLVISLAAQTTTIYNGVREKLSISVSSIVSGKSKNDFLNFFFPMSSSI